MSVAASEWARPLAIGILGGAVFFCLGIRHDRARKAPASVTELRVPRAAAPVKIDGELDDPDWTSAPARTGPFVDADGAPARPFSSARLVHDRSYLYLALYAADEDIRMAKVGADGPVWTGDAFRLTFTRADGSVRAIDVGPSGTLTDAAAAPGAPFDYTWQGGAKVATDLDGTPDDPRDHDEEWVIEMAIPLAALGLEGRGGERIGLALRRCDVPSPRRSCASWGSGPSSGMLVLQ